MNHVSELNAENESEIFTKMHKCNWKKSKLFDNFLFTKKDSSFGRYR
jgi:hypothetical protein